MKILLILEEYFPFPYNYYIMGIMKQNGEIYGKEDN